MKLRLYRNGERLKKEQAIQVMREVKTHYRILGTQQPDEVTGKCHPRKGYYIGHGACLHFRFFVKTDPCKKCSDQEIIDQLNWLFNHVSTLAGVRAEWAQQKKGRKKDGSGKKRRSNVSTENGERYRGVQTKTDVSASRKATRKRKTRK